MADTIHIVAVSYVMPVWRILSGLSSPVLSSGRATENKRKAPCDVESLNETALVTPAHRMSAKLSSKASHRAIGS